MSINEYRFDETFSDVSVINPLQALIITVLDVLQRMNPCAAMFENSYEAHHAHTI